MEASRRRESDGGGSDRAGGASDAPAAAAAVECPVCLERPERIFCCQRCDNAVCGDCSGRLANCPSCRQDFGERPPVRNKYAERMMRSS